jgi:hypothetical protein
MLTEGWRLQAMSVDVEVRRHLQANIVLSACQCVRRGGTHQKAIADVIDN